MISEDHPDPDEVEVTLLGRGVGECCVVHVGHGQWMIVDSFSHVDSEVETPAQPAARWYLDMLKVDETDPNAVRTIVLTHLDADHYRGLLDLHTYYREARLVLPAALSAGKIAGVFGDQGSEILKDVTEAVAEAESRKLADGRETPFWAMIDTPVIDAPPVRVEALSPTHAAKTAMDRVIGEALSMAKVSAEGAEVLDGASFGRMLRAYQKQNLTSIALHVTVGDIAFLLCGDVVNHGRFGWEAILKHSRLIDLTAPDLVKVTHHGSKLDDHPPLWDDAVATDPVMMLTPYWTSGLPDSSLLEVLKTRGAVWQAHYESASWVDRNGNATSFSTTSGIIQARRKPGEKGWRVATQPPGHRVSQSDIDRQREVERAKATKAAQKAAQQPTA